VRETGGLADTVTDADANPRGDGFTSTGMSGGFKDAVTRAMRRMRTVPLDAIVRRGCADFSWKRRPGRTSTFTGRRCARGPKE